MQSGIFCASYLKIKAMSGFSLPSSKLPNEKESIFTTMSKLARQNDAVDLSQGYPNFETDKHLKDLVTKAMKLGHNQYAPLAGIPELRERIVEKLKGISGKEYNIDTEVTVTNGATQALFLAITAFVNKGDEVLVFKPAYDTYEPTIELNGGVPVLVQLRGDEFEINWEEVKQKISPRTRMIIINTPHNPSGKIFSKKTMQEFENILEGTDIILLSDEVYQHLVYEGHQHHSAAAFSSLAKRSIVCASFGKTFHNTGWKMGYCVAPEELMSEIKKVHQLNVFCVNHPMQWAFAEYLENPEHYLKLGEFYQQKRDLFLDLISGSKFRGTPSEGTYFQLLDYSEITSEKDVDFAKRLVREKRLSSIPISVFDMDQRDDKKLRFCFAKTDATLREAAKIMNAIR